MKAVGFFLAVFLSMLAVFLVATGEVSRWLSPADDLVDIRIPEPSLVDGRNMLDFEFWDVKKGRRRFIIRAELSQGLEGGDPFDKLQEITLENGSIVLPLDAAEGTVGTEGPVLRELELTFTSAVYRKSDGLTGKMPLFVRLRDGRGTANEGTEFYFEELLFHQSKEDKSRFEIRSTRPVRIQRGPSLEVHSPAGLEGVLTDDTGFEDLIFRPPVSTYLDSGVLELFGPSTSAPPGPSSEAGPRRKVAITAKGPLEFRFRVPTLRKSAGRRPDRTRITFTKDVVLFEVDRLPETAKAPPPGGNRFECQLLELEIDGSARRPAPTYAVATSEGDRVRGYFSNGSDRFILHGDRLEWFNLTTDEDRRDGVLRSEAVLSGSPRLEGEDVVLDARRVVLRPRDRRLLLEDVTGTLRESRLVRSAPGPRSTPNGSANRETAGAGGETGPGRDRKLFEEMDFRAEEADIHFQRRGTDHRKVLSHFVARSRSPRGVVLEGHRPPGPSGEAAPAFRARGMTLRYEQETRELTLLGTSRELPRLSRGESWMEAEKIHLALEGGHAWFEGRVRAYFDEESAVVGAGSGKPERGSGAKDRRPPSFEIRADQLDVRRRGRELERVTARGVPGNPVELTTLTGRRYRFVAPEMHFDAGSRAVRLVGDGPEGGPASSARAEFEGGDFRAARIDFDQKSWECTLEKQVELRLRSAGEREGPEVRVEAARVVLGFHPEFRSPEGAGDRGQLSQLETIRSFQAVGDDGDRIVVTGPGFTLRGEEATWDSAKKELRFFGRDMQEVELTHEELRGPIRAREIIYEQSRRLVVLRGSVKGQLRQSQRGRSRSGPPLVWDFETSVLEVQVRESAGSTGVELVEIRARDKVLLEDRENGLKILGDDLIYDRARNRMRVFSRDGRPQTLVHSRRPGGRLPAGRPDGRRVDKILSQEIWVHLDEDPSSKTGRGPRKQLILVRFEKQVIATFHVPSRKIVPSSRGEADVWKMDADALTFYLNPGADPSTPQVLPRAVASGNVVVTSELFRAEGARAEYRQAEKTLSLEGRPGAPARLVSDREELDLKLERIRFRKDGTRIRVLHD